MDVYSWTRERTCARQRKVNNFGLTSFVPPISSHSRSNREVEAIVQRKIRVPCMTFEINKKWSLLWRNNAWIATVIVQSKDGAYTMFQHTPHCAVVGAIKPLTEHVKHSNMRHFINDKVYTMGAVSVRSRIFLIPWAVPPHFARKSSPRCNFQSSPSKLSTKMPKHSASEWYRPSTTASKDVVRWRS